MTARWVLSHGAFNTELDDLQKKERRDREKWASRNEELENELEAAKKIILRSEKGVRADGKNQG